MVVRTNRNVDGGLAHTARGLGGSVVAGRIDGGVVDVDALGVGGSGAAGRVDSGVVDNGLLLVDGAVDGTVNGATDYVDFVTVVGLEAGAVLAFSNVDDGVVRLVGVVELDARLRVGGLRSEGRVSDGGWGLFFSYPLFPRVMGCPVPGSTDGDRTSDFLPRPDWERNDKKQWGKKRDWGAGWTGKEPLWPPGQPRDLIGGFGSTKQTIEPDRL